MDAFWSKAGYDSAALSDLHAAYAAATKQLGLDAQSPTETRELVAQLIMRAAAEGPREVNLMVTKAVSWYSQSDAHGTHRATEHSGAAATLPIIGA